MRLLPGLGARRPDLEVEAGERLLAWANADGGREIGGTRQALYLSPADPSEQLTESVRIPWEQVEAADWDVDTTTLRVTEVGSWGRVRPEHVVVLAEPGRLLDLVRERVTASVVLQRHVVVAGRRGVRVIARRAPGSHDELAWFYEYDAGVDPTDPEVHAAATAALAAAQEELGER